MSLHDRLLADSAEARDGFLAIPIIGRAVTGEVPRALYLAFLSQAYHHVRHTCPLLSLAAARTEDEGYRAALYEYLEEERGHDEWILDDISAIGGAPAATLLAPARPPCRAMVGYAYHAIDRISPYALLGMVHVLEGMSTLLASQAAEALQRAFGGEDADGGPGFVYLTTHGALDVGHTAFFRKVVDSLDPIAAAEPIIDGARMFYWLYGNIFRDLEQLAAGGNHAARG
ncbi:Pyrroloquinoline quinone (PQQ) biosynthesis protein C [Tistlia consotensis]|uniref:Pyrroloquinoline quinone (PQQ) biosynthesis protein C n=1 Tax=Tistlia consotensis USBA 355 TaxID=560819 RepID=A0A1Y6CF98_9PROT|nr:iron-containing redox enzyme family protein [Tistlia consotensis]SMF60155.1 Pyrroloquinoline quinone (PQQ) biosynthesis protein C [Tistlia consotensis USBA 355]SNR93770.1 Pyrroloquinoline quinone (PQQ) biosynthesis protein C [Tistlia consotensis]